MKHHQSGFTLIEIAIVLVIIGLLLGGVLKGQELITQTKIKNVIKDFDATSVALLGYQDRYKKLPGDDNATSRWTTPLGLTSGNGNGVIDTASDEAGAFWADLRLAGFISGDTSSASEVKASPLNALGGTLAIASAAGLSGPTLCSNQLGGKVAGAVDSQLDDGKPGTGSVRGFVGTDLASAASVYLDDAATQYTVCHGL
jgi:prepilin-type N-terminal cleavage/methylation domain-containing protein